MAAPEPVLTTSRCVMGLLGADTLEAYTDYRNRNTAHLAPWEPAPADPLQSIAQACERSVQRAMDGHAQGVSVQFVALHPESGLMLAGCNFTNIVRGPFQACHLGYSVDQHWQGKGLAQEVVARGIAYMFDEQRLHRVMANHMPTNTRSARLLQALGFEREGYARAYLQIAGAWEDMVLNALINPAT